jgi:hypothetical protein
MPVAKVAWQPIETGERLRATCFGGAKNNKNYASAVIPTGSSRTAGLAVALCGRVQERHASCCPDRFRVLPDEAKERS